ncbi:hypothetical protein HHK36_025987 [Tetracentron sinense]|uniref:Retrotransposon Copia-like N-terminal domain-containing protein n=1 Tax=Tetracentron sinense TaxID=13715 RepID=A0A834YHX3_TETSI|nr:hypothetical protein HHK36_025987 [Tetracentron sinense]
MVSKHLPMADSCLTQKDDSSSSSPISMTLDPYTIHHSDSPRAMLVSPVLSGDNYGTWICAITMALRVKNKLGFVDGTLSKPTSPPELPIWDRCNDLILLMDPFPSTTRIYGLVRQEEKQQEINTSAIPSIDSAALHVGSSTMRRPFHNSKNKRQRPFCKHCNHHGHTKATYFKIHGYPPKAKDVVALTNTSAMVPLPTLTHEQHAKLMALLTGPATSTPPSANFAALSYKANMETPILGAVENVLQQATGRCRDRLACYFLELLLSIHLDTDSGTNTPIWRFTEVFIMHRRSRLSMGNSQAGAGPSQPNHESSRGGGGSSQPEASDGTRRTRGPNKLRCLQEMSERVAIQANELGQPIGKLEGDLASCIGLLARDGSLASLTYKDWRHVPKAAKDFILDAISKNSSISCVVGKFLRIAFSILWLAIVELDGLLVELGVPMVFESLIRLQGVVSLVLLCSKAKLVKI